MAILDIPLTNVQPTLVSGTNIKTINGTSILGSGDLTIASGISIGSTIGSGTAGSVLFLGAAGVLAQDNANFFWDYANNRLGIGTATPSNKLDIIAATSSQGLRITSTVSGNAGAFEIKPKPTAIGGAADFEFSNVGRLFITSYELFMQGAGGLNISGPIVATSAIFTSLNVNTLNLSLLTQSNVSNKGLYLGGLTTSAKTAIILTPTGSWGHDNFNIAVNNVADLSPVTVSDIRFTIDNSTGNVGINNTSPSAKLHVKAATATDTVIIAQGTTTQTGNLYENRYVGGTSAVSGWDANGNLFSNTGSGIKLATAADQKIGIWGATPVTRADAMATSISYSSIGGTSVRANDTWGGYTILTAIATLKGLGILP